MVRVVAFLPETTMICRPGLSVIPPKMTKSAPASTNAWMLLVICSSVSVIPGMTGIRKAPQGMLEALHCLSTASLREGRKDGDVFLKIAFHMIAFGAAVTIGACMCAASIQVHGERGHKPRVDGFTLRENGLGENFVCRHFSPALEIARAARILPRCRFNRQIIETRHVATIKPLKKLDNLLLMLFDSCRLMRPEAD
jgi:hypothetical protein